MNLPALPEGNGGGDKHHDASNGIHAHPFSVADEPSPGEPNHDRNNSKLPRAPQNVKSLLRAELPLCAESFRCAESSIDPATPQPYHETRRKALERNLHG